MQRVYGLRQNGYGGSFCVLVLLLAVWCLAGCSPSNQKDEALHKELQALKAQISALQEKVNQLQGGQQALLELMKEPVPPQSPPGEPMAVPAQPMAPPQVPTTLTVGQLLESKDRYLGTRVTVKGPVGPVMMHHKSLMLKSPQGMVEVMFGNLPDPKLVQTLTSTPIDKPVTVTGIVTLPPGRGAAAQLQINAEAVGF
jgi:outer membrane murein-binding lipoprotein Lpp